jgi:hypothetical protein
VALGDSDQKRISGPSVSRWASINGRKKPNQVKGFSRLPEKLKTLMLKSGKPFCRKINWGE